MHIVKDHCFRNVIVDVVNEMECHWKELSLSFSTCGNDLVVELSRFDVKASKTISENDIDSADNIHYFAVNVITKLIERIHEQEIHQEHKENYEETTSNP